jgi:hypothetical protein
VSKPDIIDNIHTTTSKDYQPIIGEEIKERALQSRRKYYKLDWDKYLAGRTYELFIGSIRSDKILVLYKNELCIFVVSVAECLRKKLLENRAAKMQEKS